MILSHVLCEMVAYPLSERILGRCPVESINDLENNVIVRSGEIIEETHLEEINKYEYKITSQNNEDGIIDYIFSKIPNNKYFIEIGFGYYEFNTLNLIKKGWQGKLIDIDLEESIALKSNLNKYYPKSKVEVVNTKVTKDNINKLIYAMDP